MIGVTGANGLLGSALVQALVAQGLPVRALVRKLPSRPIQGAEYVVADVQDITSLLEAFKGLTEVMHAAAVISFAPSGIKRMQAVNVIGTRNVVDACLGIGIKKMCHISSVAAVGRPKGKYLLNEGDFWEDSPYNSAYAISKHFAELEVFRGIEEGLQAFMINPSIISGSGDPKQSSSRLIQYALSEPMFYPKGYLNYIDLRDVVDAVLHLRLTYPVGERFIISTANISYHQFFNDIASTFGRKPARMPLPSFLAGVIWRFEWLRTKLTGSEPLITKETATLSAMRYAYSSEKYLHASGKAFRSWEETLCYLKDCGAYQ
jgi:dihydroflavonol-4-reductase